MGGMCKIAATGLGKVDENWRVDVAGDIEAEKTRRWLIITDSFTILIPPTIYFMDVFVCGQPEYVARAHPDVKTRPHITGP